MTKEQWGQLKHRLRQSVGPNNFTTWIEPLDLSRVSDGVATFSVPTGFLGKYVSQNFGDLILYQVTCISPEVRRVEFAVAANTTKPAQTAAAAARPRKP